MAATLKGSLHAEDEILHGPLVGVAHTNLLAQILHGQLDVAEVRVSLKRLQQQAAKAEAQVTKVRQITDAMRAKATKQREVVEATQSYEETRTRLTEAEKGSVGAQLGAILKVKGFKVGDIVAKWGGDKGPISKADFQKQTLALRVEATPAELDGLVSVRQCVNATTIA